MDILRFHNHQKHSKDANFQEGQWLIYGTESAFSITLKCFVTNVYNISYQAELFFKKKNPLMITIWNTQLKDTEQKRYVIT